MPGMSIPRHPQTDPSTLGDHEGFPIYAMPMFATVEAKDPRETARWFTEVLDFDVMFTGPDVDGVPQLTHLRRAKYQDILVVPSRGPSEPGSGLLITLQAGEADHVDDLARRAVDAGSQVDGPHDTPWNTRDFTIEDPDGNSFVVTGRGRQPLAELPGGVRPSV